MSEHSAVLESHFLNKEECVIDFPSSLLPERRLVQYRKIPGLAIVEMAGRDSVAAAIEAVRQKGYTDLLPTYAYTGTEFGSWSSVEMAVGRLQNRLPNTRVHDLLILGSPRFWQALNGRLMGELFRRYGFFTPCVGCHLYLHAVRFPLSRILDCKPIIAGERESHDGAIKVNQTATALSWFKRLADGFGTSLQLPLRHIDQGDRIEEILGTNWKQGEEQLGCVLSGNYLALDKGVHITEKMIDAYLTDFAVPLTEKIIEAYNRKQIPDHPQFALEIFKALTPTETFERG